MAGTRCRSSARSPERFSSSRPEAAAADDTQRPLAFQLFLLLGTSVFNADAQPPSSAAEPVDSVRVDAPVFELGTLWEITSVTGAQHRLLGQAVPAQSMDDLIIAHARVAGLRVTPLETLMEQFAGFDCIDTQAHLHILRDAMLTPAADFKELTRETLSLYAQQRLADLMTLQTTRFPRSAAARKADAELAQCAIDDRSERFLAKLDELLLEPGQFVAVGAAHLVGPKGLLARLHERGFRVRRVATDEPGPKP